VKFRNFDPLALNMKDIFFEKVLKFTSVEFLGTDFIFGLDDRDVMTIFGFRNLD
jgi:hypothetical protein